MFSYVFLVLFGVVYSQEKVNLNLYFESLCPGCLSYIEGKLKTAWDCDDWTNMVNISVYPYGNANEYQEKNGTWIFHCQHGNDECEGNLVETCFINLVSWDQNKFMDFFITYEQELLINYHNPYGVAQKMLQLNKYIAYISPYYCIFKIYIYIQEW